MSEQRFLAFHASKHSFDWPDYQRLNENRVNHDNGALGLWVANTSDWIAGFGSCLYKVEFSGKVVDLSISELAKWSSESEGSDYYAEKRQKFLAEGVDYLRLVEQDGRSSMGVIVNFNCIDSWMEIDPMAANEPIIGGMKEGRRELSSDDPWDHGRVARTLDDAKQLAAYVMTRIGMTTPIEWSPSESDARWQVADVAVGTEKPIRLAVSSGGVVQVDGKSFEGEKPLTSAEPVTAVLRAAVMVRSSSLRAEGAEKRYTVSITYEVMTPESAARGDAAERGYEVECAFH